MIRTIPMLLAFSALAAVQAAGPATIVVWAPGYPGDTVQAQDAMDDLARGVGQAAGWPEGKLAAVYHQTVDEGLAALRKTDAALALVPAPVLFEYGAELGLAPTLAVVLPTGDDEVWSLVAKKGRISGPRSLAGWELAGAVGYAPDFVRGPLLGTWGGLPDSTRIVFTPRVLNALRRTANGEDVAVLIDRAQTEALSALPFFDQLEVVSRSEPLPASFLCVVDGRLPAQDLSRLRDAFLSLHGNGEGAELLASLRMVRFEPVDPDGLSKIDRQSR